MSMHPTMDNYDQTPIRPDLLHALIDHAEHGITIAEREGNDTILLYINKAFEKMTGYSADECLYKDCRFLQGKDHQQAAIQKIHQAIQDQTPVQWCYATIVRIAVCFGMISPLPRFSMISKV